MTVCTFNITITSILQALPSEEEKRKCNSISNINTTNTTVL